MIVFVAAMLVVGAVAFTLLVRSKDLPEAEPSSPVDHLEARKLRIYDSLRDLQFEYRVGKLSETDYQTTKAELQRELARVTRQIEKSAGPTTPATEAPPAPPLPAAQTACQCPHCGAEFDRQMKFCGDCGQPMKEVRA